MFSPKQEEVLARLNPEFAEKIRESMTSKHRMHQPHMDMIPISSVSGDQSSEQVSLKEYEDEEE